MIISTLVSLLSKDNLKVRENLVTISISVYALTHPKALSNPADIPIIRTAVSHIIRHGTTGVEKSYYDLTLPSGISDLASEAEQQHMVQIFAETLKRHAANEYVCLVSLRELWCDNPTLSTTPVPFAFLSATTRLLLDRSTVASGRMAADGRRFLPGVLHRLAVSQCDMKRKEHLCRRSHCVDDSSHLVLELGESVAVVKDPFIERYRSSMN